MCKKYVDKKTKKRYYEIFALLNATKCHFIQFLGHLVKDVI